MSKLAVYKATQLFPRDELFEVGWVVVIWLGYGWVVRLVRL